MARAVVALLVFIGGNAFAVWLGNRRMPEWALAATWVGSFIGAALIAWWPRWKSAHQAFWRIGVKGAPSTPNEKMTAAERDAWLAQPLAQIQQRRFESEVVELDGKAFLSCTFLNVRFMYHGAAPFSFFDPKFERGKTILETDHPALQAYSQLSILMSQWQHEHLHTMSSGFVDENGNVTYLSRQRRVDVAVPAETSVPPPADPEKKG